MKTYFTWGLAALVLFGLSVAYAQTPHTGHIDDTGALDAGDQHIHAKAGHTITWTRKTGAGKPWYVKFTGKSPCSNGTEFGSDRAKTCQVNAVCKGGASCTYPYTSATGPAAQRNDPDVIVDP